VLAVTAAVCLPVYWGGYEPGVLRPLALGYAVATEGVLRVTGVEVAREATTLRLSPSFAIDVTVHCTAWIYFALWIAGLATLRLEMQRALHLGAAGLWAIAFVNLIRLVGIALFGLVSESSFEVVHLYFGEAILVGAWAWLWNVAASSRSDEAHSPPRRSNLSRAHFRAADSSSVSCPRTSSTHEGSFEALALASEVGRTR
jgi:exosortase/archaeosortase family protein